MRQQAYARRVWGAKGADKTNIALDVGYSKYVARSASSKIEATKGFQNAMTALARESNNMALTILHEFRSRGVKNFSNKDLVGALNAIGGAWSKFNVGNIPVKGAGNGGESNRLRAVIMQQVEHQTINAGLNVPQDKETPVAVFHEMVVSEEVEKLKDLEL